MYRISCFGPTVLWSKVIIMNEYDLSKNVSGTEYHCALKLCNNETNNNTTHASTHTFTHILCVRERERGNCHRVRKNQKQKRKKLHWNTNKMNNFKLNWVSFLLIFKGIWWVWFHDVGFVYRFSLYVYLHHLCVKKRLPMMRVGHQQYHRY